MYSNFWITFVFLHTHGLLNLSLSQKKNELTPVAQLAWEVDRRGYCARVAWEGGRRSPVMPTLEPSRV